MIFSIYLLFATQTSPSISLHTLLFSLFISLTSLISPVSAQLISTATWKGPMNAITYDGCYSTPVPLIDHGPYIFQTSGNCQPICYQLRQPVMGLSGGSNCWCGQLRPPIKARIANSSCDTPCNGYDKEICGGKNSWSIYLTGITRNKIPHLVFPLPQILPDTPSQSSPSPSPLPAPLPSPSPSSTSPSVDTDDESSPVSSSPVPSKPISHRPNKPTSLHGIGTTPAPSSTVSTMVITKASVVTVGSTVISTVAVSVSVPVTVPVTPTGLEIEEPRRPVTAAARLSSKASIAVGAVVGVSALAGIVLGSFVWLQRRKMRLLQEEYKQQQQLAAVAAAAAAGEDSSSSNGHGKASYGYLKSMKSGLSPTSCLGDSRLDHATVMQRRLSDGSIADNEDYSRRILRVANPDDR